MTMYLSTLTTERIGFVEGREETTRKTPQVLSNGVKILKVNGNIRSRFVTYGCIQKIKESKIFVLLSPCYYPIRLRGKCSIKTY